MTPSKTPLLICDADYPNAPLRVGDRIAGALAERGMNQTQLARLLAGEGASEGQIASARRLLIKWINNEHLPSPVSARKLALALQRDVSYFLAPERSEEAVTPPETVRRTIEKPEGPVDAAYQTVLRAIEAIDNDYWRSRGLTAIAHAASPTCRIEVLLEAVDAATSCQDEQLRAEALMHVAAAAQGEDSVLARVTSAGDGVHDESALSRLLSVIATHATRGSTAARRAAAAARTLSDPLRKGHLLASLVSLLEADERQPVFREIEELVQIVDRDDAIALLVEACPLADELRTTSQAELLVACQKIADEELRARRLARFARCRSEYGEAAASAALDAAGMASVGWTRAALLLEIQTDLPARYRGEVMRQVIEAIAEVDDDLLRANALSLLAEERSIDHDIGTSAIRVARTLVAPELKITTFIALLGAVPPRLRAELVDEALVLAEEVVDSERRVKVLVRLSSAGRHLVGTDIITELLESVRKFEDPHARVDLLGRLIASVPPGEQSVLALECVRVIDELTRDPWHRAIALVELAERLPAPLPPSPRVLSGLQDTALILRARNGDAAALDALIRRYTGFVRLKATSYFLAGGDAEDLVQEGLIGFYKAVRDFSPDKETSFRSFAELCVTRQIITAIKTATRYKHAPLNTYVSFNHTPASQDSGEEVTVSDALAGPKDEDPATIVISTEELESLALTLGTELSPLESDALRLYLEGSAYEEMAEELGCDTKAIDNALQRVKRKILTHQKARQLLL